MRKALFVGGTGTISSGVVRRLCQEGGWEVWLLNRGNRSDRAPAGVHRIVADIREHPEKRRTVVDMARTVGKCESLFASTFKHLTGFPPAAFIAHCRIQKARELLEKGDTSIAAIAGTLGYSSAAHFSSQFRLFCGMSPRDCRRASCNS